MKVITLNANGIRSAQRKGFFEWLRYQRADVVCLQDLKAQMADLGTGLRAPSGYQGYFHEAQRRGYSGVALYCRRSPDRIRYGLGWTDIDAEGRYLQADFGDLSIISLYLPSGSAGPHRQAVKESFLERFRPFLKELVSDRRQYLLCGDWNIAHRPIDLRNWRSNQKNTGFLPHERAWMDWLFGEAGLVDVFRHLNQDEGEYTWWSNRGQARANNVGWRIDYHVATPGFAECARSQRIYRDRWFSDHAPLSISYDWDLGQ
ncbi:MAG: exodeoxyribonuclease III [Acidiferrobacteraceae bacterium]